MHVYTMQRAELQTVQNETDLRVIIQNDLKEEKQCIKAAAAANKVLSIIRRTFTFKEKNMMLQLYKSLVRPHLEYCIQAWRPYLQKTKIAL